jgi:Spy/CpxP family protein refolding chaperone
MLMKRNWIRLAAVPAMAAGLLLAQDPATGASQQPANQYPRFARLLNMIATALDLTAAQKEQAQSILADTRQSAQPIRQQLQQSRQSLVAAIKAGDNTQIDQIAANQGILQGQLTAIRGKAFAQIYALLTPQQKTKADQMYQNLRGMLAQRFGR